jgi:hypothetical protein
MKTKIVLLAFLLFLTSCSDSQESDDFIYISTFGSVFNDTIIDVRREGEGGRKPEMIDGSMVLRDIGSIIYYTDLTTLVSVPVCARPNCVHEVTDTSCTARYVVGNSSNNFISRPFIYNDSLYFISNLFTEDIKLIKCDLFGGNRRVVYTHSPNPPENENAGIMFMLVDVHYNDSKLYLLIRENGIIFEDTEMGNKGSVNLNVHIRWLITEYDLATEKHRIVYDTGFWLDNEMFWHGIAGGKWFFSHKYNSNEEYHMVDNTEMVRIRYNEDFSRNMESGYWDTFVDSMFAVDIESGEVTEVPGVTWGVADGEYFYSVEGKKVFRLDPVTLEREFIFEIEDEGWLAVGIHDNKLFISLNRVADRSKRDYYYLEDDEWHLLPDNSFRIEYETRDKFIGFFMEDAYASIDDQVFRYITKEDFYAGNDNYIFIWRDTEA